MASQHLLKIGELASQAKISVETLRYYESKGLLTASQRSSSGYRLYAQDDVDRLGFIIHAKQVGFSLREIEQLLGLRVDKDAHTCEQVKQFTGAKLDEIDQRISQLQRIRQQVYQLHEACCGGPESAQNCTILQALEQSGATEEEA